MVKVKNIGNSQRVVYNTSGRAVHINPGQEVEVDLVETHVERLRDMEDNPRSTLKVISGFAAVRRKVEDTLGLDKDALKIGGSSDNNSKDSGSSDTGKHAEGQKLIAEYEDKKIGYHEFTTQAKELLGDDHGLGAIPKKEKLYEALNNLPK